jgi:hypothetical protein
MTVRKMTLREMRTARARLALYAVILGGVPRACVSRGFRGRGTQSKALSFR